MTPWPPSRVPCDTASSRPNAGTTAPAGSTSILRSPPVISLIFFAKSSAYSWKMSLEGQVLCQRRLTGPCALTTLGAATTAAVARTALLRNLRREVLPGARVFALLIGSSRQVWASVARHRYYSAMIAWKTGRRDKAVRTNGRIGRHALLSRSIADEQKVPSARYL